VGDLQTRDAAAAVAAARAALELRPRDAGLHNLLGIALAQLGRADEAAAEFGRALALDPGLSAARRNLAHALGPP
jgi:Flp pilus assembly protein TadD